MAPLSMAAVAQCGLTLCRVLHCGSFHSLMLCLRCIVILCYIILPSALKFDVKPHLRSHRDHHHGDQEFKGELMFLTINISGAAIDPREVHPL